MDINKTPQKIRSLEFGRFVAAILVVLHHATLIPQEARFLGYQPLHSFFFPGHMGVEFFFVLSGFIIMHAHADDLGRPDRLGSYLWRRISRIFIPYWIVLAVLVPMYLLTGMGTADKRDWSYIAMSAFLVPQTSQPVLGVAWTLTHEFLFYAIFALCILNRLLLTIMMMGWLSLILINQYVWNLPFPGSFLLSLYNVLFILGIGCAWLLRRVAVPRAGLVLALGLAVVVASWVLELSMDVRWDVQRYLYGVSSVLIILSMVELERSGRLQVPSWLVLGGAASYGIYLVHAVVQSLILNVTFRTAVGGMVPDWALFATLVVVPVLVGLAFHRVVEKPAIGLFRALRPGHLVVWNWPRLLKGSA